MWESFSPSPATGEVYKDPQFYASQDWDYNLKLGSPCIDSADPQSLPDPDGSQRDMGALPSFQTAPQVALTDPAASAQEVPRATAILATFDMPMDPTTINGDNFLVQGLGGDKGGIVTYDPLSQTATFTPDEPFAAGETVLVQLVNGIRSLWALTMLDDYVWEFEITSTTGVETPDPKAMPGDFVLLQNYPNPFNAETLIEYQVPQASSGAGATVVVLEIYNALGQRVRSLAAGPQSPGWHTIRWNGLDVNGRELPSGVYFYRLEAEGQVDVKKLVLLR